MHHFYLVYIYPFNSNRALNSFEEPRLMRVETFNSLARELNTSMWNQIHSHARSTMRERKRKEKKATLEICLCTCMHIHGCTFMNRNVHTRMRIQRLNTCTSIYIKKKSAETEGFYGQLTPIGHSLIQILELERIALLSK